MHIIEEAESHVENPPNAAHIHESMRYTPNRLYLYIHTRQTEIARRWTSRPENFFFPAPKKKTMKPEWVYSRSKGFRAPPCLQGVMIVSSRARRNERGEREREERTQVREQKCPDSRKREFCWTRIRAPARRRTHTQTRRASCSGLNFPHRAAILSNLFFQSGTVRQLIIGENRSARGTRRVRLAGGG